MKKLPLSILEFGQIDPPDYLAHDVINNLFQDISFYESIGYKRFWMSEHYSPEFAWYNPEILIPLLAGYTENIKIGIAGILLAYHSPLRVAQTFRLLSSIYSDRIDLGIARAGIPENTAKYLISPSELAISATLWDEKIMQLFSFLREDDPEKSLISKMVLPPQGSTLPEAWFLGASGTSISKSVKYEANFCLSFMHPGSVYEKNIDVIKRYISSYEDAHSQTPGSAVLIACLNTSDPIEIKKLEERYNKEAKVNIFGTAEQIADRLTTLKETLQNDEFIIYCPVNNRQRRLDNFESIITQFS